MPKSFRVAFVAAWLFLGVAGCAETGSSTSQNSPPSASVVPTATLAVSAERAASCSETRTFITSATSRLVDAINSATAAGSDLSQEGKTIEDITAATKALSTGLAEQAVKTDDAELKAALREFETSVRSIATAMEAAGNDLDKILESIDLDAMERFDSKVENLCT